MGCGKKMEVEGDVGKRGKIRKRGVEGGRFNGNFGRRLKEK